MAASFYAQTQATKLAFVTSSCTTQSLQLPVQLRHLGKGDGQRRAEGRASIRSELWSCSHFARPLGQEHLLVPDTKRGLYRLAAATLQLSSSGPVHLGLS